MREYYSIINKLQKIKKKGYIKTHRAGSTGIGKTLEDLLGIKENNLPGPNARMIELKSARKNTTSLLTLFTKSPLPRRTNALLLEKFGYRSVTNKKKRELHTTVSAKGFNKLKKKSGFKIAVEREKIKLVTIRNKILGYWDRKTLQKSFEKKMPKLLYVKADSRRSGSKEEFWYNEAWLLSGFNFRNFVRLLQEGTIVVDIRIGKYADTGKCHDHGTAFRVLPAKLDLCFKYRERIL